MTNYLNPITAWLTTGPQIGETHDGSGVTLVAVAMHGPFLAVTLSGHGDTWTTDYPAEVGRAAGWLV